MKATFLFLGTGASAGIPMIGCHCEVCSSSDPHNKRFRPSGIVMTGGKNILIDTGPDLRMQILSNHIEKIDGVIYTHTHFDHVAGLDDLRAFYFKNKQSIPVLLSHSSYEDLKIRYYYIFKEKDWTKSLAAQLDFQVFEKERGECLFLDIPIRYFTYQQLGMKVNGYRFGNFAYVTDIKEYQDTIFDDLKGCEILILSAQRPQLSRMHFTIDEAIKFGKKTGAKNVWFTHMAHEIEHEKINKMLPQGFQLGYDGLKIEFEV